MTNMKDLIKHSKNILEGKEKVELEEAFMRLPSTVIGSDLYSLQKDLSAFMYSQMKNRDFNPKQFDDMIKRMQKIKKSAKKFNKASDMGPEFRYRGG